MEGERGPLRILPAIMDDLNLHYRFLNWRRRIREIREVRAVRYQERFKHILVDGDTLSYQGNSGEVGCYVAPRPLTKDNNYFEVSIVDSGVRGTIAVGLVPQYYSLDHQPGWLPDSVAYHADDGKLYNGRAKGRQFGTKCSSGDRIGCGIEPVSFEVQTAQIFFTKNGKRVGSTIMPLSPEGLFPAVGMHSLGEEVRLHLHAELGNEEEDDSVMMVDSYEDEWGRLHDVKVCGTDYPKNRHPGWSRGSVAYHADDGKIFHGSGVGDPFGPRCYKGDIMGCGIMFPRDYILDSEGDSDDSCDTVAIRAKPRGVRNVLYLHQEAEEDEDEEDDGEDMEQEHEGKKVVVFFTRNGKIIGKKDAVVPSGGFYPTIGMLSSGEKVKVDLHPLSG
ncbi:SPRY domain-containing protein 3 isoform X3 [Elgaria multicarinata webbii]|uniref:SPRY domain-containing protein 3 isoform X3 n=1 Tax=Elgaria multicarinata webbii TaxID=159646 RepID=UPI002FCD045F